MEVIFEDYIIKLFNSSDELVGKVITHEFPTEEQLKAARKSHINTAYATIDKMFTFGELPFSE